jgi:hypothetical protein
MGIYNSPLQAKRDAPNGGSNGHASSSSDSFALRSPGEATIISAPSAASTLHDSVGGAFRYTCV